MKKILLSLFIATSFSLNSYWNLFDNASWTQEAACFKVLNDTVAADTRFKDTTILPNWDLTSVLYDEVNSSYIDFSNFWNFFDELAVNPANSWGAWWDDLIFEARRNNIWTIINGNNYVYSQISGFWRNSNFDFPLESKTWRPFWDKYKLNGNFFKEFVIYTHHVRSSSEDYPLMSCGIAKVVPLGGRSFSEINESGYMTNILNWDSCASGFEWGYTSQDGEDFYTMKANVCVQSYDESDYLKLELISVALDNDSKVINEYYTNPLQVEAMRDNRTHSLWLKWIQDEFRKKLVDETCYKVIHWSFKRDLPAHCSDDFGPITYSDNFNLSDLLFPQAYAEENSSRQWRNRPNEQDEELTWLMVYGNLPYTLYSKLELIPDESFRDYMLLSVLPNFDELTQNRKDEGVLLTPFEEVFLSCKLDYPTRLKIVINFLENLDVENFSLSSLDYLDEKYGDCIIPYPDKDKLSTVVEGSFESNQLLAQKLSWEYVPKPDSPEILNYIKLRENLLEQLNASITEIDRRFNIWEIDENRAKVLKIEEKEKIDTQLQAIPTPEIQGISASWSQIVEETLW